jgi:hypothetical protein
LKLRSLKIIIRAPDNTGRARISIKAVSKIPQQIKGKKIEYLINNMVFRKFKEDKSEDIPDITKPIIMRSRANGDRLIREVLNGG